MVRSPWQPKGLPVVQLVNNTHSSGLEQFIGVRSLLVIYMTGRFVGVVFCRFRWGTGRQAAMFYLFRYARKSMSYGLEASFCCIFAISDGGNTSSNMIATLSRPVWPGRWQSYAEPIFLRCDVIKAATGMRYDSIFFWLRNKLI